MRIEIFPCADTLLYAPIYFAIELLAHMPEIAREMVPKPVQASGTAIRPALEYVFGDRLTILLHPPTNGDEDAIIALQEASARDPSNIYLALADPMAALNAPVRQGQTPKILTTFINRVALWAVYLKPTNKSGKGLLRPLEILLEDFSERRLHWFTQQYEGLRIACYEKAATNDTIVRAMFSERTERVPVEAFGVSEITPVFNEEADLAFTTAPWVASQIVKRYGPQIQKRMNVKRFIPPLRYPYCAVVTTDSIIDALSRDGATESPIGYFLRALQIAFVLTQRAPHDVAEYLARQNRRFASYGLATYGLNNINSETIHHIAHEAMSEIVHTNCLSDVPFDPWHSWELAFLLTNKIRIQSSLDISVAQELFANSFRRWNGRTLGAEHHLYSFMRNSDFLGKQTSATIAGFRDDIRK